METAFLLGLMAENIMECIVKMKKKDRVYLNGLMEGYMMDNGPMENSMEAESILVVKQLSDKDFGRMAKGLDGKKRFNRIELNIKLIYL